MQENNPNIHNLSAPPFEADNKSCILDRNCNAIRHEVKENVDQHGAGKEDTASLHIIRNDPVFANSILPLTTAVHGILNFLVLEFHGKSICLLLSSLFTMFFLY